MKSDSVTEFMDWIRQQPWFQKLSEAKREYLEGAAAKRRNLHELMEHMQDKSWTHSGEAGKDHQEYLTRSDITLGPALQLVQSFFSKMNLDRTKGTQTTKARAAAKPQKVRDAMLKHFAKVDYLEGASEDKIRDEYDRGTIAECLWNNQSEYFETSPGACDGRSPYSESRLRDHVVGKVLKQLILDKKIPPEPPPLRARRK